MADRLVVRGAREHNLRDVSLDLPRRQAHRLHRALGVGQVVARLRHHLRRGPAPLRRVPLVVRAAVPRDRWTSPTWTSSRACRPPSPSTRSPRSRNPRSTVGHGHRDLRLPPAALRPGGPAPLPELRAAGGAPDAPADRRPDPRPPRGDTLPGARPGGAGAQGRVRGPARRPGQAGLRAGPGRRRGASSCPTAPRLEPGPLRAAHHRGGRRPPGAARRHPPASHRVDGDRTAARRRRSPRSASWPRTGPRSWSRSPSTWPARTAGSRFDEPRRATSRSTRPTAPARRATGSGPDSRSIPSWSCPNPTRSLADGAIAPWAGGRSR